jgi:hypothetical protein
MVQGLLPIGLKRTSLFVKSVLFCSAARANICRVCRVCRVSRLPLCIFGGEIITTSWFLFCLETRPLFLLLVLSTLVEEHISVVITVRRPISYNWAAYPPHLADSRRGSWRLAERRRVLSPSIPGWFVSISLIYPSLVQTLMHLRWFVISRWGVRAIRFPVIASIWTI